MSNPEDKISPDMAQCKCLNMSCIMRKTAFFICENKGGDQLHSYCSADQRLCFSFIDSTFHLLHKSEISRLSPSSVAVHPGLCGTWLETCRQVF